MEPTPTSHFPLSGLSGDGFSTPTTASATCYCGSVQLSFPISGPGFLGTFVCNCTDCRKITATMFATNFTIADEHITHVRGRENLTEFTQTHTTSSGKAMSNYFCKTCGTLMYRFGDAYPGRKFLRTGTVDDFALHDTVLRPQREIHVGDRVSWFRGVEGAEQIGVPLRKKEEGKEGGEGKEGRSKIA